MPKPTVIATDYPALGLNSRRETKRKPDLWVMSRKRGTSGVRRERGGRVGRVSTCEGHEPLRKPLGGASGKLMDAVLPESL